VKFCEHDGEFMLASRLGTFLNLLVEPLGLLSTPKFGKYLELFIHRLNVPQSHGLIHYIDLGTTLTLKVFGNDTAHIPEENEFMQHLRSELFRRFPKFKKFKTKQTSTMSLHSNRASTMRDEPELSNHSEDDVKTNTFEWRQIHYLSPSQRDHVLDMMMAETQKFEEDICSEDLDFGDGDNVESSPSTDEANEVKDRRRSQQMFAVQEIKQPQNIAKVLSNDPLAKTGQVHEANPNKTKAVLT